ncbi:MAG TPA: penicillin acylase family protein, partial [Longimicrobiales bacterium]|nr:penicillin acylase family protein [Longimicrobiales bacterium]
MRIRHGTGMLVLAALITLAPAAPATAQEASDWRAFAEGVEITRTERGIPHIMADDWGSAGFGLAWAQLEDYGIRVVDGLLSARGTSARHYGPGEDGGRIDSDMRNLRSYRRAVATFDSLPADVRAVYTGFAAAVNRFISLYPEDAPPSLTADFKGVDVHARDVGGPNWGLGSRFASRLERERTSTDGQAEEENAGAPAMSAAVPAPEPDPESALRGWEPGSNVWALAPERTASGNAVLVRNPHLSWTSGYYEGHLKVPGEVEFYGDFRIGGPFGVIGGWNRHLGWSTTNNGPELSDLYRLRLDPDRAHHVLYDGASIPLEEVAVEIEVLREEGLETVARSWWESPIGPVIHRDDQFAYVVRSAGADEYRLGAQFMAMMEARSLEEWKDAMRMQARTQSNFTYADADGNIFYVWNAMHPVRPHPFGADSVAHLVEGPGDHWVDLMDWDDLPQLLNPEGGYLRNENDPFHFTNLNEVIPAERFGDDVNQPRVRLRSQHSLELLHNDEVFSLEEIVDLKHSERMLLADRVLPDLLDALRAAQGSQGWTADMDQGLRVLEAWDRTVAVDSRGGVLFREWWDRYMDSAGRARGTAESVGFSAPADRLFAEVWSADRPLTTPHGLADADRAVEAFRVAVPATLARWGRLDRAWGEIHRARHGNLDLPVSGCDGLLGCFRVLWFSPDDDGRLRVRGGDGWVSAVEFGDRPRAYTVLAYGQSDRAGAPHDQDQLRDFVEKRMTPVAW